MSKMLYYKKVFIVGAYLSFLVICGFVLKQIKMYKMKTKRLHKKRQTVFF